MTLTPASGGVVRAASKRDCERCKSPKHCRDGLKREFKVVVPAADLDAKVSQRLDELKDQVRINGFRPGKVPVAHLKRIYGRSVMAETIEAAVRETNCQDRHRARLPARAWSRRSRCRPKQGEVEQVIEGKSDLAYTVAIEVLPPIELADFKGIKLERLVAEVTDAEVDEALEQHRRAEPAVTPPRARAPRPRAATASRSRLHRHDRRRAVRGRHRRRRRRASSAPAPSFRASRSS